jgi:hypothetical protein
MDVEGDLSDFLPLDSAQHKEAHDENQRYRVKQGGRYLFFVLHGHGLLLTSNKITIVI